MITAIVIGIGLIAVGMQLYFFLKTLGQSSSLTKLIPPVKDLKTVKVFVPDSEELDSEKVLSKKHKHVVSPEQRISEESFFEHLVRSEEK